MKNKVLVYVLLFVLSILSIFFSLYSVSSKSWVWDEQYNIQKIFGVMAGLAAFSGLLAVYLFSKNDKNAYWFAYTNALSFGLFALSINLSGDFLVNIIWYIPLLAYSQIKRWDSKFWKYEELWYLLLLILTFVIFIVLNPYFNIAISKIVGLSNFGYGSFFQYYWISRVLDSYTLSICVVAMVMMIRNYRFVWYVWCTKNIVSIIIFSGIGILNVSAILMNVFYLALSIFIIIEKTKAPKKDIRIAFIGPGAVGKTTTINYLKDFFAKNGIEVVSERPDDDLFIKYMKDMKKYAFEAQKAFFGYRLEQVRELSQMPRGMMDRHLIDDFIFPHVHIKEGNFNEAQSKEWQKNNLEFQHQLSENKKLDLLFVFTSSNEVIESRRIKRSKSARSEEISNESNKDFFRQVNKEYQLITNKEGILCLL